MKVGDKVVIRPELHQLSGVKQKLEQWLLDRMHTMTCVSLLHRYDPVSGFSEKPVLAVLRNNRLGELVVDLTEGEQPATERTRTAPQPA